MIVDQVDYMVDCCREFSEFIIGDEERMSVFVAVEEEWFIPLLKKARTMDFWLTFKTVKDGFIWAVFAYDPLFVESLNDGLD